MPGTRALIVSVYGARPSLVAYAKSIVGNGSEAEDVVQEATVRFLDICAASGNEQKATLAYLRRIVRNAALDLVRRRSRERQAPLAEVSWLVEPTTPPTPEELLLDRQALGELEAALSELPDTHREALMMHRLGGYRLREIAEHLEVSVPTAHRLVRDALTMVAARMAGSGE